MEWVGGTRCVVCLFDLPLPGRYYIACEPVLHAARIASMIWIGWLVGVARMCVSRVRPLVAFYTRYLGTVPHSEKAASCTTSHVVD